MEQKQEMDAPLLSASPKPKPKPVKNIHSQIFKEFRRVLYTPAVYNTEEIHTLMTDQQKMAEQGQGTAQGTTQSTTQSTTQGTKENEISSR